MALLQVLSGPQPHKELYFSIQQLKNILNDPAVPLLCIRLKEKSIKRHVQERSHWLCL